MIYFHTVDRLPSRGLGTMKDVKTKKLAVVATAALVTVRANKLKKQQISGFIPAKQLVNSNQETITGPPVGPVEHRKLSSPQRTKGTLSHTQNAIGVRSKRASVCIQSQSDSSKKLMDLTKNVDVVARKPAQRKKKAECKLVKPEVPIEEPFRDESLAASGPQDETFGFPLDYTTQGEITSHLQRSPIEEKSTYLTYPPLPTEQEVYSVDQQEHKTTKMGKLNLQNEILYHRTQIMIYFRMGFVNKHK